ncbi:hypothetical protein ACOALA_20770 (plasmid) [Alicyclobacillus acidoterrestris]|uniref:hypothetical protein n=1 Tax=Alicyclobacillus acidoterrestris TaxID=1450 RepID=UPI003F52DD1B
MQTITLTAQEFEEYRISDVIDMEVIDVSDSLVEVYYAVSRADAVSAQIVVIEKLDDDSYWLQISDEYESPVQAQCPASILEQLTPTDNPNALAWRTRCREALASTC